jgi:A/G-specific adenine glycosylase
VTVASRLAPLLLAWWDRHGRHDLPWQQDTTPYRVWVSEIMLQQTQVATVERYYGRFMQSFPRVAALAAATQDEVLHHWSGLGYYSRARNLHKAAQTVVAEYDGVFPTDIEQLTALPGIGRSTAGAILALACDQPQPILDGNVKRVLARLYALEGWPGTVANQKKLWEYAEACTPHTRVANYTQAIMDLGATVCTRSKPACNLCPLQSMCAVYKRGLTGVIPAAKPRKPRPRRAAVIVMAVNKEGAVLLEKRPPAGIWGGLWSFPELESLEAVDKWCAAQFGVDAPAKTVWSDVSHSFSHFDFDMRPVEIRMEASLRTLSAGVMEGERWLWYNTRSPADVGLAAPVAKLLQTFDRRTGGQE